MDEPIGCGYDWFIDQVAPMTDPKNPEAQNEELDLEQLEDAAGGAAFMKRDMNGATIDMTGSRIDGEAKDKEHDGFYKAGGGGGGRFK